MTSFVHVDQPTEHPGVVRAQRAAESIRNLFSPRGFAGTLLAAGVIALVIAVSRSGTTLSENQLLAGWIALWVVAFSALALLIGPASTGLARMRTMLQKWEAQRHSAMQDQKLWQAALADARVMADISRAMSQAAERDVKQP